MKTLKDFTPEIQAKIPLYKDRVLKDLCSGKEYETNDIKDSIRYVHRIYEIAGYKKPLVFFAKNPIEYRILFEVIPIILMKKNASLQTSLGVSLRDSLGDSLRDSLGFSLDASLNASLNASLDASLNVSLNASLDASLRDSLRDSLGDSLRDSLGDSLHDSLGNRKNRSSWMAYCSIYSRVFFTWYKFIQDEFQINHNKKEILNELYSLVNKTFISRCWFTKSYVLVLKTPTKIHFNENNVLHNVNGCAYEFEGYKEDYYINGRKVEKELIEGVFTKEDLINEHNEDKKAAMITIIKERHGDKGLLDFLGAEIVDSQTVEHFEGYSEEIYLYKTKEKFDILQDRHGNMGQPYCWTGIKCPSTGQDYLIENSADFTDALEALKWLRPSWVPQELEYKWTEFAN